MIFFIFKFFHNFNLKDSVNYMLNAYSIIENPVINEKIWVYIYRLRIGRCCRNILISKKCYFWQFSSYERAVCQGKHEKWSLKSVFIPLYGTLVCRHTNLSANPRGRYQPSGANSKTNYEVGNWRSSPPLQRKTATTGPSFLAVAATSGQPDYRL